MKKVIIIAAVICLLFVSCDMFSVEEKNVVVNFYSGDGFSRGLSTGDGERPVAFAQLTHQIKLECLDGTGYCSLSGAKDGFVAWPSSAVKLGVGTWRVYAQSVSNDVVWYNNTTGVEFKVSQKGVSTDAGTTWGTSISITESYCGSSNPMIVVSNTVPVKDEAGEATTLGSDYRFRMYRSLQRI